MRLPLRWRSEDVDSTGLLRGGCCGPRKNPPWEGLIGGGVITIRVQDYPGIPGIWALWCPMDGQTDRC